MMTSPGILMKDVRNKVNVKTTADEIDDRCEKWVEKIMQNQFEIQATHKRSIVLWL